MRPRIRHIGAAVNASDRGSGSANPQRLPADLLRMMCLPIAINAFEVTYRQDLRAEYEAIIARIAKSLRPGRATALPEKR